MPYIDQIDRLHFDDLIWQLNTVLKDRPGELNYVVTKIVKGHLDKFGSSYKELNAAIGVLECAKQELYRRVVAPYENIKIVENGDVYHGD